VPNPIEIPQKPAAIKNINNTILNSGLVENSISDNNKDEKFGFNTNTAM
jgi:hypothetical protein